MSSFSETVERIVTKYGGEGRLLHVEVHRLGLDMFTYPGKYEEYEIDTIRHALQRINRKGYVY